MGRGKDRDRRKDSSGEDSDEDQEYRKRKEEKRRKAESEEESGEDERNGVGKGRGSHGSRRKKENSDSDDDDDKRVKGAGGKKRKEKARRSKRDDSSEDEEDSSDEDGSRARKKEKGKSRSEKKRDKKSKKKRRRTSSKRRRDESSDEDSDDESDSESGSEAEEDGKDAALKVSEEELREYLAARAQKKALKLAKKLRQKTVSGYSNDSNPFGDTNLTETFVWRKKIEKDVLTGHLDPRDISVKKEKERLASRTDEIEKVKKRREERLLEKARHEEEMALLARERARAEFQDWEEKEDQFHFEQSKVRSEIRLREGRAKPIDVLARNLNLSPDFDVEVNEPYKIYKGLTVKEMEELKEDIKLHLEFDRNSPTHIEFWTCMMVVCNYEIAETMRRDILDRAKVRGEEPPPEALAEERGLHNAVNTEVDATLAAKGSAELAAMEERIQQQMETGGAKLVEYWESVLKRLKVFKAKARLREIHADLLRKYLEMLQSDDKEAGRAAESAEEEEEDLLEGDEKGARKAQAEAGSFSPELMTEEEAAAEGLVLEDDGKGGNAGKEGAGAEAGSFSPQLMHAYEGEDVVDPEADKAEQEQKRLSVIEQQQNRMLQQQGEAGPSVGPSAAGAGPVRAGTGDDLSSAERAQALKMMGPADGDAILGQGSEVNLDSQVYWWHDKFRPRKPKYFNRVHTGYEWNKYNQTHYDHDNPPPKIVQGYKFNIFYPDLIDRSKAPAYSIDKDGSGGETCLIRFHAGPPYEDIAFRVVNKEWEYSHKKGFKCTFDRGILHVYFNFKRYRYRR